MPFTRIRLSIALAGALIGLLPSLATAQTSNPFHFLGNMLSQKPAALGKLLDEKKLEEADAFFGAEQQFFWENKEAQAALIKRLADGLNGAYEPRLIAAEQSVRDTPISPLSSKQVLSEATELAAAYRRLNIFQQQDLRSPALARLEASLATIQTSLALEAVDAFQRFDHFGQADFFESYPIRINGPAFFNDASIKLSTWIDSLNAGQVKQFRDRYLRQIEPGKFLEKLAMRHFSSTLAAGPVQPPDLAAILSAMNATKGNGFILTAVPGARIAFVEVTSRTLQKEGQIEFPTQIQMDLPFESAKVEVDQMLDMAEKNLADYIVVLDVAAARATRKIAGKSEVESRYVSGSRSEPNPSYDIARSRLFEAQAGLANANALYAQGIAGAIAKGIAIAAWQMRVNEAMAAVSNTPAMLSRDLFESYRYSASEVGASRNLTANYYVIDKGAQRYFKSTLDIADSRAFRIAYNLHDKDPERGRVASSFDKEADIAAYEQSPIGLKVSSLIDDYLKNQGRARPLQSLVQLRDEMLIDKNKALAEYKSKQFDATPVNDNRFESVVVVLNPQGALGAGFYVAPDLVLTNFHVIEGAKFVEMRLRNGLETFGKIVKTDVRLDLALIKVQTVGRPVSMFTENTLELGATVEAIGHPKGLTFTLTRGIVSALRKQQSVNAVGGKEVLFVQTDAAINPGNSGGPLFWKDKVIGVNNNKLVKGAEGLGFAVHYSEVIEFMKEPF